MSKTTLLKKQRVKVMDWPSRSQDLNPTEHLWGILTWKVGEHKVSTSTSSTMLSWKSIFTLGTMWTISLRSVLTFVAGVLDINGCMLNYFEGTANFKMLFVYTYIYIYIQ